MINRQINEFALNHNVSTCLQWAEQIHCTDRHYCNQWWNKEHDRLVTPDWNSAAHKLTAPSWQSLSELHYCSASVQVLSVRPGFLSSDCEAGSPAPVNASQPSLHILYQSVTLTQQTTPLPSLMITSNHLSLSTYSLIPCRTRWNTAKTATNVTESQHIQ